MFLVSRPRVLGVVLALAVLGCGPAGGSSPQGTGTAVPAGPTVMSAPPSLASTAATSTGSPGPVPAGRIAFGRFDNAIGDFQVFTMLADGSDVRLLLPGAHEGPAWSPDYSLISVTSFGGGDFLKILHPDGSLVRDLKAPGRDPRTGLRQLVAGRDTLRV